MIDDIELDVDKDVIRQAVGYLKMEPLAYTDPNDNEALTICVKKAAVISDVHKMKIDDPVLLARLALAVEQWSIDFAFEKWALHIFSNPYDSAEERVNEIYRYKAFMDVGPDAIDFPLYCIIRFQDRNPDTEYEPADIHMASDMGLKIAQEHGINDLVNTYFCVEMILVAGENYMDNPQYKPMQLYLKNDALTPDQRIDQSYEWLTANLEALE